MNVHAIGHHGIGQRVSKLEDRTRNMIVRVPGAVPVDLPDRPDTDLQVGLPKNVDPASREEATGNDGKARGVIRLLEAGHFQGVADVRLRVNFFDELSERAAAASRPVIAEQSNDFLTGMTTKVDELVEVLEINEETQALIDKIVDEFEVAVRTAVDERTSGEAVDLDSLSGTIQSAFDALIQGMKALLRPPGVESEPPLEAANFARIDAPRTVESMTDDSPAPAEEPLNEPTPTVEEAIASLTEAFQEALAAFLSSINEAMQLPDPSPPRGRGDAYDKFLAIYNGLRGLAPTINERA